MPLPELTKAAVSKKLSQFCNDRVPPHIRDKVRLDFEFRGNNVTLLEIRPVWNDPSQFTHMPVAQLRFENDDLKWTLYCCDRNSKWHIYKNVKATTNIDTLIKEIDADPTGIFWG